MEGKHNTGNLYTNRQIAKGIMRSFETVLSFITMKLVSSLERRNLSAAAIFDNKGLFGSKGLRFEIPIICHSRRPLTSTILIPLTADRIKSAERHILQQTQLDRFPKEFYCVLNYKFT